MKITSRFAFLSVFLLLSLKGVYAATDIVYCESPYVVANDISYCGQSVTTTNVFPGTNGYAAMNDNAIITTSTWTNNYMSMDSSFETISTSVYPAVYIGGVTCLAKIMFCAKTQKLFYATITHFTVYAPEGNIATITNLAETTVTATVTDTSTETEVSTVTVTDANGSCPTADVQTTTKTETVVDSTTVTESVTYNYGSGSELTIYTSGPTVGTSTYTSCF